MNIVLSEPQEEEVTIEFLKKMYEREIRYKKNGDDLFYNKKLCKAIKAVLYAFTSDEEFKRYTMKVKNDIYKEELIE